MNNIQTELEAAQQKLEQLQKLRQKQLEFESELEREAFLLDEQKQKELKLQQQYDNAVAEILKQVEQFNKFDDLIAERTRLLTEVGKINNQINQQLWELRQLYLKFRQVEFTQNFPKFGRTALEFESPVALKFVDLSKLPEQMVGSFKLNKPYLI